LGAYSKRTTKQAGSIQSSAIECTSEHLRSVLGSVQPSRLGVYDRVQLGAYLRALWWENLFLTTTVHIGRKKGMHGDTGIKEMDWATGSIYIWENPG